METGDGIAPDADIVDLGIGDVVCGIGTDDSAEDRPCAEGARREPGHVLRALSVEALRQFESDKGLDRVEDGHGGDLCVVAVLVAERGTRTGTGTGTERDIRKEAILRGSHRPGGVRR